MLKKPSIRVLCLPDIDRAIGGVKQLYRHVEHLTAAGWDAAVITQSPGFLPTWFQTTAKTISLNDSLASGELDPFSSIIMVPETYIGLDFKNFYGIDFSKNARVIFNQNAYYTYGRVPEGSDSVITDFYDHPNVLHVLSVSEDTHCFLNRNIGLKDSRLSRIINAVEPIFRSDQKKNLHIHWMPRKNADHAAAVLLGLQKRQPPQLAGWQGQPLSGLAHTSVAERLNTARLFLAFGHPEGFGLPIVEAMAAGCWVVGYSGGGGSELFRYGASNLVPFGDWSAFVEAIERILQAFREQPYETELKVQRQALAVKALYSFDQERASIVAAWQRVESAFYTWLKTITD